MHALPGGRCLLEHRIQPRQTLAFHPRPPVGARLAWGSRSIQSGVHPQWGDPSHAPAGTRPSPCVDTVSLVADHRDLHSGPPAPHHQHHLARPVRHRLMTSPQPLTHLGRRGRDTQHRQGPCPPRPGGGDDPRQHDPPPPAGGHGAWRARRQWIAVMPTRADTVAPSSLQRLIDDERQVTAHSDKRANQEMQQAAPQIEWRPSCPVGHVMVEAEIGCIVQAHLAEGGRHGPPTPG